MFLFSYYAGEMANVDVCNMIWDCIQEDRIVYERLQFLKTEISSIAANKKSRNIFETILSPFIHCVVRIMKV